MISSLDKLSILDGYSTTYNDLLSDFYIPCLQNSISYKRRAGYFNSGLIALAPLAFANFVKNGGRMQLICNPSLKVSDYEAIMDSEGIFFKGKDTPTVFESPKNKIKSGIIFFSLNNLGISTERYDNCS
jgi:hypothetical protein